MTSSWYEKFNGWHLAALVAEVTALPFYCQNDAHILTIGYCIAQQISLQQTIVGMYNPEKSMPGITLLVNGALFRRERCPSGRGKIFARLLRSRGTARPQGFGPAPGKLTAILQCSFCPPLYHFSQQ